MHRRKQSSRGRLCSISALECLHTSLTLSLYVDELHGELSLSSINAIISLSSCCNFQKKKTTDDTSAYDPVWDLIFDSCLLISVKFYVRR